MESILINPAKETWSQLIMRPAFETASLEEIVMPVLQDVKTNGDVAVKKYAQKFDKVSLNGILVSTAEIDEAVSMVSDELKAAIELAKNNISLFHAAQLEPVQKITTSPGVLCWRKSVAIQNVGLYIPGGTAPLFSTLLMLAVPAQIAGCSNICICTPSNQLGQVNPVILFTARLLGIENIYKVGGIQAIAAMAYGTETIPAVNKIFGPGNQYVTTAKQLVSRDTVAIDMPAGPSELAVYAEETAEPAFVAADLLSQAEHGIDSQVVLVASAISIVEAVKAALMIQLNVLPRKEIAQEALKYSQWIVMENPDEAFDFLNEYAPEHLIIAAENAEQLADKVINAGSVFLGNYSPESAGDYASGTNHTLPTNGFAKAYSGISVDSFIKKITFQKITKEGIKNIGPSVEIMASAEGLVAHKNAISVRLKHINDNRH